MINDTFYIIFLNCLLLCVYFVSLFCLFFIFISSSLYMCIILFLFVIATVQNHSLICARSMAIAGKNGINHAVKWDETLLAVGTLWQGLEGGGVAVHVCCCCVSVVCCLLIKKNSKNHSKIQNMSSSSIHC